MRAILLAADDEPGLHPLTLTRPSAMLCVGGVPLLELWLNRLAAANVESVVVSCGRGTAAVRGRFGDGRRYGLPIGYAFEGRLTAGEMRPLPLGEAAAASRVHRHSGYGLETVFIARAGACPLFEVAALVKEHRSSGAAMTAFGEHCWLVEPIAWDHTPAGPAAEVDPDWIACLERIGLCVVRRPGPALRRPASLEEYLDLALDAVAGRLPNVTPPGVEIARGVRVGVNVAVDLDRTDIAGPVYIGAGSVVRAGARIRGPVWIGPSSVIDSGIELSESVLGDFSRLAGPLSVHRRIIEGDRSIGLDGEVEILNEVGASASFEDLDRRGPSLSEDLLRLAGKAASRFSGTFG